MWLYSWQLVNSGRTSQWKRESQALHSNINTSLVRRAASPGNRHGCIMFTWSSLGNTRLCWNLFGCGFPNPSVAFSHCKNWGFILRREQKFGFGEIFRVARQSDGSILFCCNRVELVWNQMQDDTQPQKPCFTQLDLFSSMFFECFGKIWLISCHNASKKINYNKELLTHFLQFNSDEREIQKKERHSKVLWRETASLNPQINGALQMKIRLGCW